MTQLTIYKASAGSGKTYRLVAEYLKLLIENPQNYRHILAVTFTNKATSEMKERIISELYKITTNGETGISKLIEKECGIPIEKIKMHALEALGFILHDYGRFTVSTIDSFFQKVLRSFARETGLYGAYAVELDQAMVLEEACSRLLMSVEENKMLFDWLLQMSEDQLEKGENWQVNRKILDFGQEVFNETFYPYLAIMNDEEALRLQITTLREKLRKTRFAFENDCKKMGQSAINIISDQGITIEDFVFGKASFANQFRKLGTLSKDFFILGKRFVDALDNVEKWYSKTSKHRAEIEACYQNGLNDQMHLITNYINDHLRNYLSALQVERKLFVLGIIIGLVDKIREIGQENNTLLLSEGVQILRGVIGNNDAPFIYEKVGNYFNYFMIDEFQDTSVTQWENFKPLVINTLAEHHPNLVVGDVKQSIYRWRNSDWQLLNAQIVTDLRQFAVTSVTLDSNWRSCTNIVEFNNALFSSIPKMVQDQYNIELSDFAETYPQLSHYHSLIEEVYNDAQQEPKSGMDGGRVEACFFEADKDDEYEQLMFSYLIEIIEKLQNEGVKAGDIAILIRRNSEAQKIVSAVLDYRSKYTDSTINFDIISDDALLISNAISVKFMVSMIKYMVTPFDDVLKASLVYDYAHHILPQLKEIQAIPPRIDRAGQQTLLFDTVNQNQSPVFDVQVRCDYFPFFDQKGIESVPSPWAALSVNELIARIVSVYALDRLDGEQANIQAFRDLVFDFGKREPLTLHRLLTWWDDKGKGIKLQSSGDRDAIKVMTIHKSKGLEFPHVIVPYCNWAIGISSRQSSTIWCNTENTPFNDLPVVPVTLSSALRDTCFAGEYLTELMLTNIDNLNLLYVAFTRAVQGLYLFGKKNPPKKNDREDSKGFKRVNDLIYYTLVNHLTSLDIVVKDETGERFSIGDVLLSEKKKASVNEVELYTGKHSKGEYASKLRVRVNYDGFLNGGAVTYQEKINRGKSIHEVLGLIKTKSDLDSAILSAMEVGILIEEQMTEVKDKIETMFQNPVAAHWFDGDMKIINETSLLEPSFSLYRPDRVMIDAEQTVVVEYKSGEKNQAHLRQLKRYMQLVRQAGYQNVTGYLWYINPNELIEVF